MTAPFINKSINILVMVAGAGKAAVLHDVLQGPRDPKRWPIQMIEPADGKMSWLIDAAAAKMLK